MVKYVYDAWGNHDVHLLEQVYASEQSAHIGSLNPFRYRGYYYDTEIKLYYLKTRYYDSTVGRFITIDDLSYIDPEHINGLNLYAYCGNNPVMNTDTEGTSWWSDFWNSIVGKIIGTIITIVAVVGAVALTVVTLGAASPILAAGIIGGVVAGGANVITQGIDKGYSNIDFGDVAIQTVSGFLYGVVSVALPGVGGMFVKAGLSAATTVATGIYHGEAVSSIVTNAIISFATSLGLQQLGKIGLLDKLNISHLFGNGRWVDFVSDKFMDKMLVAMDFGNYFIRELTIGVIAGAGRLFNWIRKKVF